MEITKVSIGIFLQKWKEKSIFANQMIIFENC